MTASPRMSPADAQLLMRLDKRTHHRTPFGTALRWIFRATSALAVLMLAVAGAWFANEHFSGASQVVVVPAAPVAPAKTVVADAVHTPVAIDLPAPAPAPEQGDTLSDWLEPAPETAKAASAAPAPVPVMVPVLVPFIMPMMIPSSTAAPRRVARVAALPRSGARARAAVAARRKPVDEDVVLLSALLTALRTAPPDPTP